MIARTAGSGNIPEIICGFVLLVTLFMPWWAGRGEGVVMSWDILVHAPTAVVVLLIVAWAIGLATVVLSLTAKGLPLSASYAGMGFLGIIFLLVAAGGVSGELSGFPTGLQALGISGRIALGVIMLVALIGLIIVGNLFSRLGGSLAVRVLLGILAGALIILGLVELGMSITDYARLPAFVRRSLALDFVLGLLSQLAVIAACILMLVQAAAVRIRKATLCLTGLCLIYGTLAVVMTYCLVRPAVAVEKPGMILPFFNSVAILGSIVYLFCSGVTSSVVYLARWVPRVRLMHAGSQAVPVTGPALAAPAAVPPDGAVAGRLRELDLLRQQGAISDAEYFATRSKIVSEI